MIIFSGVRSTGKIHLGNYLSAIKQWVNFQEKNDCIFCVVDLHAITTPYDPKKLQKEILETVIAYLALGIDPEKSILFVQSKIKEHTELAWLLNTITSVGELNRMTQYKEKKKQHHQAMAGLLNYPVLMTADILLYQTDIVPVGKDQQQHVEIARTLAKRFNQRFGKTFKVPEAYIAKVGGKIMSLNDPRKKMSKSIPSSCLFVFDEPKDIKKKIMSAVTDTGKQIKYNPSTKPGISNLLTIYSLLKDKPIKEIEQEFKGKNYSEFKKSLINVLINTLGPFRKKRKELLKREVYIREFLTKGEKQAQAIAQSTIQKAKKRMGL